jgi:hypothetical protein
MNKTTRDILIILAFTAVVLLVVAAGIGFE